MKLLPHFSAFFVLLVASLGAAQTPQEDGAAAIAKNAKLGYVRVEPRSVDRSQIPPAMITPATVLIFPPGASSSRAVFAIGSRRSPSRAGNHNAGARQAPGSDAGANAGNASVGGTTEGVNTVPTFAGAFAAEGGPSQGSIFPFIMMGNHPLGGGTTVIPDKIAEVSLMLLNADGSVKLNVPFAPFEDLTLGSPNFAVSNYRSGSNIQFADAVQRAEFFNRMGQDWHTVLDPRIVNRVTLTIPKFVTVAFPDGTTKQVQAYHIGTAADGNPFVLLLDILFDQLFFDETTSEINAGNFTTDALNTAMLPNTLLFSIDNQGNFADCCLVGFHTFRFDASTTPENIWIVDFATWGSPGTFHGFEDVTALSHETSESFNDPLLNNATPSWQFPGSTLCQDNLETGDPVEVLPNAEVSITLRESHEVFTFHPQTEALLQWFEMGTTSNAIDGAFSFPNEGVLPHSATPCPK